MSRRVIPGLEAPDAALEADIRARLDQVEQALEKSVRVESSGLLSETSSYLIAAGGKRFRAMLVLLAGYFGDPTDPRLIGGSVSIELVHLATLYHDDVIDEADARRGAPSANMRWDNTVAILSGDFLFARASEISTELGTEVCRLLARTIAILCDGQIREVDSSAKVEQPESNYLEIIRRKTASLIAHVVPAGRHALGRHARAHGHPGGVRRRARAWPSSSPTTSWTSPPPSSSWARSRARTSAWASTRRPVLHALAHDEHREELARILGHGAPDGELLDRALEIVRGRRVDRPRPRGP